MLGNKLLRGDTLLESFPFLEPRSNLLQALKSISFFCGGAKLGAQL